MKTNTIRTAASPWGPPVCSREQFGNAPFASVQGSGLSTAGYGTATAPGPDTHAAMTLAAVRQDDARVPEPRGRQR